MSTRGITLVDKKDLGEWKEDPVTGMTMLPGVSGEGGYGGQGEYKKYPETTVIKYEVDDQGFKEVGREKTEEVDFIKSSSQVKEVPRAPGGATSAGKAPKKKRGRPKKEQTENIQEEESDEPIIVTFKGSFGETTAPYLDAFFSDIYLILVADPNSTYTYTPPQNDEGFQITFNGGTYQAYSIGLSFTFPDDSKKVTALLVKK